MGESDRYIEYRNRSRRPAINFNINSPAVFLIIINFTVFLFVKFLDFGKFTGDTSISPYFSQQMSGFLLPADFTAFLNQPWGIISYGFFHFSFINLISNMLWLWAFGGILQGIAGNRKTVPLFLYGVIAGGIAFLTTAAIFPNTINQQAALFGANAGVMAIAVAVTVMAPDFRIFQHLGKGIPIWVLTAIYLLVDLIGLRTSTGAPFYVAHLAGALIGALFMYSYMRGNDWGRWMHQFYLWLMGLFSPGKSKPAHSVKEKVFYQTGNRAPYNKKANITQQRVDEILDKISQKGYQYLTEEEKNILKRAGEEEL